MELQQGWSQLGTFIQKAKLYPSFTQSFKRSDHKAIDIQLGTSLSWYSSWMHSFWMALICKLHLSIIIEVPTVTQELKAMPYVLQNQAQASINHLCFRFYSFTNNQCAIFSVKRWNWLQEQRYLKICDNRVR